MDPIYLGDGLYAQHDGYQIRVWASNGVETTNEVFFEPETFKALQDYAKKDPRYDK